jgi:hypothetical protein
VTKQADVGSVTSSVSAITTNEDKKTLKTFQEAGTRITLLSELWPKRSLLRQPPPPNLPPSAPWHPERLESDAAWALGNVAELYHFVPEFNHEVLEHSALFATVVRG